MQCDCFSERLNFLLDNRQEPCSDPELMEHASNCAKCDNLLSAWQTVQLVFDPSLSPIQSEPLAKLPDASIGSKHHFARRWVALAVAVTFVVFTTHSRRSFEEVNAPLVSETPVAGVDSTIAPIEFESIEFRVHEPQWWGEMAAATLRPVEPLAKGIRPLTSSFQSAIQILSPRPASRPRATDSDPADFSAQRLRGPLQTV